MSKIKGGDLMLFIDNRSVAYATNHTLEVTSDTSDLTNKDEGGGTWNFEEINKLSWNVSTENLYSLDGKGNIYSNLYDCMIMKRKIDVVFAEKMENSDNVTKEGWSPKQNRYTGKVYITSLSLNAPSDEYATFTAQFTGVGPLTRTTSDLYKVESFDYISNYIINSDGEVVGKNNEQVPQFYTFYILKNYDPDEYEETDYMQWSIDGGYDWFGMTHIDEGNWKVNVSDIERDAQEDLITANFIRFGYFNQYGQMLAYYDWYWKG